MSTIARVQQAPPRPSLRGQLICLWLTPVVGVVLLVAFLSFPGFFPPMSPGMTADQVAEFYANNTTMIRFSMITYNLFGIMLVPLFALIVVQMKRMATPTQVLAYCYLTAVVSGATLFALADIFWLVAAYRPERNPQLIQLLNDLAWITFIAPVGMLVVQNLCLALAVYLDARDAPPRPVFPRWVAPFSVVTAAAMTPAACAAVFRTGPLAWDGLVSFWLRIGAFTVYVVVMFFVLRAAIKQQAGQ
ncbi:hypothetical protein [Mycobacterium shimoidei]|uniref:DUF4386 family protein n=1 Tax=Mycobacterium shimoidei TaxID=29313 RepID=A0A1E3TGP3_MYCSH|nr:hypothetical protein [Mycobacterium shimoidei]MCV7261031.1 hypothetical protein [Mycobacterium shimoidei]ODR13618.1 hypothetical protein BHQ16_09785 [Mycobacterium shimoidei]ORW76469.1 hypothetical protein AWC26_20685 [Mycobacterium shimoidei]SRX93629.1 hypothetical protein MSP7336_01872 [Mycobacterium shimoidei]